MRDDSGGSDAGVKETQYKCRTSDLRKVIISQQISYTL